MTRTIIELSGNLDRPSKTRALVQTAVARRVQSEVFVISA